MARGRPVKGDARAAKLFGGDAVAVHGLASGRYRLAEFSRRSASRRWRKTSAFSPKAAASG